MLPALALALAPVLLPERNPLVMASSLVLVLPPRRAASSWATRAA
jgi:hypothetical protein